MAEPEHHARLWANTNYFREELQSLGFDTGLSETPIIPVMCGESANAKFSLSGAITSSARSAMLLVQSLV